MPLTPPAAPGLVGRGAHPLGYLVYAGLTAALAPLITLLDARRYRAAGLPGARIAERGGWATTARPDTTLVWFHAVSVGEAMSVGGLIRAMGCRMHEAAFLVTTTSIASAELIAQRMPPRTRHQFAPLDVPGAVRRFLSHWRPNLAVFVESEFWPRQILAARAAGIPLVLINARFSDRSLARWKRCPGLARTLLDAFSVILAKDSRTVDGLVTLGGDPNRIVHSGDLKAAADPLPVDGKTRAEFETALAGRPLWVAASTHPGEEVVVAEAHRAARAVDGRLLLVVVPRHPVRGPEIARELRARGWELASRSAGEPVEATTQIYLADTLGETGLWYSLSSVVFLGGSLVHAGGHNPFEPASLGAAVLHGPHVANFADTYREMDSTGAARCVTDATELARVVPALLGSHELTVMQRQGRRFVEAKQGLLDETADRVVAAMADPGVSE